MILRIDARRLTDAAGLHETLSAAFGFPPSYGKNLDALVDCLTYLDDPDAGMSRVHVSPGQVALLVLDHANTKDGRQAQLQALIDAVAFVNWRRLEQNQPPVLALAYEPPA
jgi:hypothetical protein